MKQNCQIALYDAVNEGIERFVGFGSNLQSATSTHCMSVFFSKPRGEGQKQ